MSIGEFSKKAVIKSFEDALIKRFKRKVNLKIDFDYYPAGYFYKSKNYVLLTEDGKKIFHGAAMKASSKNLLSKNLINELAEAKLHKKPTEEIKNKYLSLNFPLKWFAMNIRMGRPLYKYKSLTSLAPKLALLAKNKLGITPETGNIYHYIAAKGGQYKLYQTASPKDIDRNYYRDQVETILKIFNAEPLERSLDEWL